MYGNLPLQGSDCGVGDPPVQMSGHLAQVALGPSSSPDFGPCADVVRVGSPRLSIRPLHARFAPSGRDLRS
jgi:hypothetical protein